MVFPRADIKFYLTANVTERAKRRRAELRAKGCGEALEQIQKAIKKRDKSDESRAIGPLRPADDAVVVDTTNLSIEGVVETLLRHVEKRCLRK